MLRWIHKVLALSVIIPLMAVVISGTVLSVMPALERAGAISHPADGISVAELAGRTVATHPGVEQIKRLPSGKVIAFYAGADGPAANVVDPSSGEPVSTYAPSAVERWMTNFHRSFFLGDGGRMAAGAAALALLVLTLSGLQMTARRMGGWARLLDRSRGGAMERLHADLGRLATLGLIVSTLTALFLSLTTFGVIPDGQSQTAAFPTMAQGGPALPLARIEALRGIDVSQLRELTFPNPADPTDVFRLTTAAGEGYVDPASGSCWPGRIIRSAPDPRVHLQGAYRPGFVVGRGAARAECPRRSSAGRDRAALWWRRRRAHAPIAANIPARTADTVILVGSEGGSTWGFARTLHAALTANGHKVHTVAMEGVAQSYPAAQRLFVLTATHGDGTAPASAGAFLERLDEIGAPPPFPFAVLGFGDRQFPQFCRFARDVDAALTRRGWTSLLPLETIDRQSPQEFARWGKALSAVMGEDLVLAHVPERPRTHALTLIDRIDYGTEVQAPTCVLRFALPGAACSHVSPAVAGRNSLPATCWRSCRRARPCRATIPWPARPAMPSSRSACANIPAASARACCMACGRATASRPS